MKSFVQVRSIPWVVCALVFWLAVHANAQSPTAAQTPLAGASIPKFIEPLPVFGPAGSVPRVTENNITVEMLEIEHQVLPASYPPTWVWAYKVGDRPPVYPGVSVEATRGIPNTMTYINRLPVTGSKVQQLLALDQTLHWANPYGLAMTDGDRMMPYSGPPPAVVHLHGGETPSEFDGGPDQWYLPEGTTATGGLSLFGPSYRTRQAPQVGQAQFVYSNTQQAATLWFHDHTLGATRLNVYAGLAAFYLLRDPTSKDNGRYPELRNDLPAGPYEIEMAIQDRMFDTDGQLYFPSTGINPDEHPFWIPEFFGDVIVVNGKSWPYLDVQPRRYRFRILNGSNARFYDLSFGVNGPPIFVIGSDGGLLDTPAPLCYPNGLLLGPGERADVIIDFAGFQGKKLVLKNKANAPYPTGIAPDPSTVAQIMRFRVAKTTRIQDITFNPLRAGPHSLRTDRVSRIRVRNPAVRRQLTLNESMGLGGPLEILVNNTKWSGIRPDGTPIPGGSADGAGNLMTELPHVGSTEVWEIINLTADAHPIHLHLVQFQLINRQAFVTNRYLQAYEKAFPGSTAIDPMTGTSYPPGVYVPGFGPPYPYNIVMGANGRPVPKAVGGNPDVTPFLRGMESPPYENEMGWKDTFVMLPGQVTRVAVRFKTQENTDFPFDPTGATPYAVNSNNEPAEGPGYVWHCHIVDHEDNEMMRPYRPVGTWTSPTVALAQLGTEDPGTEMNTANLPVSFELGQNYPNPFNPSTEIRFSLPDAAHVTMTLYNSIGQEVKTLIDSDAPAGYHTVKVDGRGLASGIYYYRIVAGSFSEVKSMVLVK